MYELDRDKNAFVSEQPKYQYNVIPFGLKNIGATYKRMMNKDFKEEMGETLEIYVDDMIVKLSKEELHG